MSYIHVGHTLRKKPNSCYQEKASRQQDTSALWDSVTARLTFLMTDTLTTSLTFSSSASPHLQLNLSLSWTCAGVRPAWRWAGSGSRRSRACRCPSP